MNTHLDWISDPAKSLASRTSSILVDALNISHIASHPNAQTHKKPIVQMQQIWLNFPRVLSTLPTSHTTQSALSHFFLSFTFHQVKTLSLPLSSESYKGLCFKQSTISFSLSFWVLSSEILFVTTKGWKSNPNSMAKSLVVSYGCNKVPHSLQHRTLYPNNCHSLPPLKPTLSLTLQNQNQKPLSLKYNSLTTLINRRVSSPITAALDSDVPHPLHQVFPQSQLSVLCIMIVINKLVLVSLC